MRTDAAEQGGKLALFGVQRFDGPVVHSLNLARSLSIA